MKKALFVVCFLASMVYGLERGATSNFKYIIDTGVQSIYVLQNRTGGYDLSFQQYYCFVFWKTNKNIDRILVDTVCQNTTGNIKKTTRIKYVIRG